MIIKAKVKFYKDDDLEAVNAGVDVKAYELRLTGINPAQIIDASLAAIPNF